MRRNEINFQILQNAFRELSNEKRVSYEKRGICHVSQMAKKKEKIIALVSKQFLYWMKDARTFVPHFFSPFAMIQPYYSVLVFLTQQPELG